jgi:hypothetical protein
VAEGEAKRSRKRPQPILTASAPTQATSTHNAFDRQPGGAFSFQSQDRTKAMGILIAIIMACVFTQVSIAIAFNF